MTSNLFRRLALTSAAGLLIVCNLWGQGEPIRNWAAPLYWQPSAHEAAEMHRGVEARSVRRPSPDATSGDPAPSPLVLVAITPCRLVDTRSDMPTPYGSGSSTPLVWAAGSTHSVVASGLPAGTYASVSNPCVGLPVAGAYSANLTVWPQPAGTILKWLSVCPTGTPTATCSGTATLTGYEGGTTGTAAIVSNGAVIPVNSSDSFDVYVTDNTWVIIDITGYYADIGDSNGNTALGVGALLSNTGTDNTATGNDALESNTTGYENTASGTTALQKNTSGQANTATGSAALQDNTTGAGNTAIGTFALAANSTGGANAAAGFNALLSNTTGSSNSASGATALQSNTTGNWNTATGTQALLKNTTASFNTASGGDALYENTTGTDNTAIGYASLANNTTGSNDIAIGFQAGQNVSVGNSNNVHIGTYGAAADSGTIRIGGNTALGDPATQAQFFASGIRGVTTGQPDAVTVVIDSNGQLGTVSSSRRYKEDIQDMADSSSDLMLLRPVTFRYTKPYTDGTKPLDYGLIAEEVEEVYPGLVARNAAGEVETVQYYKLIPMLLNELQKQNAQLREQSAEITQFEDENARVTELRERLAQMESAIERLSGKR